MILQRLKTILSEVLKMSAKTDALMAAVKAATDKITALQGQVNTIAATYQGQITELQGQVAESDGAMGEATAALNSAAGV
jgi:hypothetical protein